MSKKVLIIKKSFVMWVAFTACILFAMLLSIVNNTIINAKEEFSECVYISYEIKNGDTIASIAGDFTHHSNMNINKLTKEIERVNRLSDSNLIAGAHLVIPVLNDK